MDAYVGDEQYAIYDDARDYFVAGQYVVFYAYDDDYSQHYFIGNSEGMYTSIGEWQFSHSFYFMTVVE